MTALQKEDTLSVGQLSERIVEWRRLDDAVRMALARDSASRTVLYYKGIYRIINDSIHAGLYRLAVSGTCSYHDLLYLHRQTSPYLQDTNIQQAAEQARSFFDSIDSIPVQDTESGRRVMRRYRLFLDKAVEKEFLHKDDLLYFISEDYVRYKAFLQHLPEYADSDMSDIIRDIERCCERIFRAANDSVLPRQDAMIYLTMRMNLRLMRTAQAALADLDSGKVRSRETARAYMWMLVQPFMLMDDLSVALMSDEDISEMYRIADAMPKETEKLAGMMGTDKRITSEIPVLLMKIYITRL